MTTETLITIDGCRYTIPEARTILGIPDGECFGCYLGDASPDAHDLCYLADYHTTDDTPVVEHGYHDGPRYLHPECPLCCPTTHKEA